MISRNTFSFPFNVNTVGRVAATGGDEAIRAKIIQVLFTAPGERINNPTFGCGLLNKVFEPNNAVFGAALEFTIAQALSRWLKDEILVRTVDVQHEEAFAVVQILYTRKQDLSQQAVRIQFK